VTIVPRWEWRAFGEDVAATAADGLARAGADRVEESREMYVLSELSDASVKVRDELVDVKRLLTVADDGLEQWVPVMKAPFPVAAANVARMLEALGAPAADLERPAYTLDELREEIVAPCAWLRAVEVAKRRVHYTVGGCMAEATELRIAEGAVRTVAVEAEDPERVRATVRDLGLAGRPVVCVARGLKALAGIGAHRYAVIDVGTNSVKFHVGERRADGTWRTVADRAQITRLGEGLAATGALGAPAIERTAAAIAGMAAEARSAGVEAIAAVGTAALRIATNAADLIRVVHRRCGVRVEVISGEDETRLAYLAARAGVPTGRGPVLVFDTGGGSSQFTFGRGDVVDERFSVDVGAARFTERFGLDGPVAPGVLAAALGAIARDLVRVQRRPALDTVVGMGGAVTNLAAVRHGLETYDPDVVQGTVLDRGEIERQIELYRSRDAAGRRAIVGLQPDRAEVILAGACIVRTVLTLVGAEALTVSDRGLRHGLIAERFGAGAPAAGAAGVPLATTAAPG
jgi:exopolyphosphatase / guanosine-5'-triphosphate,3'-diphosphate pyrophosphatase